MGLSQNLVDKIIFTRRGKDGQEATEDDHIFLSKGDLLGDLQRFVKLEKDEVGQIIEFMAEQSMDTHSYFYHITSHAHLDHSGAQVAIHCVFDSKGHTFSFWKVEY